MKKCFNNKSLFCRLLCYGLIAAGILLLLIFVPYAFWVVILGVLMIIAGLILLRF